MSIVYPGRKATKIQEKTDFFFFMNLADYVLSVL